MWSYEKRLQYPVKVKTPNPALAKLIATQYGGPNGERGASLRYLSQRYTMPYPELKAILTDIGTEELAHLEMVSALVYQLTRNLTPEQIRAAGYDAYFVDHTTAVYPVDANGMPFNAQTFAVSGDTLTDLHEDLAAEQKARATYDNILRYADDPDVRDVIQFLRQREIVHYQRFGEAKQTGWNGPAPFPKDPDAGFSKRRPLYSSFGYKNFSGRVTRNACANSRKFSGVMV